MMLVRKIILLATGVTVAHGAIRGSTALDEVKGHVERRAMGDKVEETPAPTWPTPPPTPPPTPVPTAPPTPVPTSPPTPEPTKSPTPPPTPKPTEPPKTPKPKPTESPTSSPTAVWTNPPTSVPTSTPTPVPTSMTAPPTEPVVDDILPCEVESNAEVLNTVASQNITFNYELLTRSGSNVTSCADQVNSMVKEVLAAKVILCDWLPPRRLGVQAVHVGDPATVRDGVDCSALQDEDNITECYVMEDSITLYSSVDGEITSEMVDEFFDILWTAFVPVEEQSDLGILETYFLGIPAGSPVTEETSPPVEEEAPEEPPPDEEETTPPANEETTPPTDEETTEEPPTADEETTEAEPPADTEEPEEESTEDEETTEDPNDIDDEDPNNLQQEDGSSGRNGMSAAGIGVLTAGLVIAVLLVMVLVARNRRQRILVKKRGVRFEDDPFDLDEIHKGVKGSYDLESIHGSDINESNATSKTVALAVDDTAEIDDEEQSTADVSVISHSLVDIKRTPTKSTTWSSQSPSPKNTSSVYSSPSEAEVSFPSFVAVEDELDSSPSSKGSHGTEVVWSPDTGVALRSYALSDTVSL